MKLGEFTSKLSDLLPDLIVEQEGKRNIKVASHNGKHSVRMTPEIDDADDDTVITVAKFLDKTFRKALEAM